MPTLKVVKAPTPLQGSLVRDNLDLGSLAAMLTLANNVLNEEIAAQLTLLMEEDKRQLLHDVRDNAAQTCNQMLCAVLLNYLTEAGPEGAKASYYLSKEAGPEPLKQKIRIERYRRVLLDSKKVV
jgi:hypothetical protein